MRPRVGLATRVVALCALGLAGSAAGAQDAAIPVSAVELFGSAGLDAGRIRASLPVREGDKLRPEAAPELRRRIADGVRAATGSGPTDVAIVCCDERGGLTIYVGLAGASTRPFAYDAAPRGPARLPGRAVALHRRLEAALAEGARAGRTGEDTSRGYSLAAHPAARAVQLEMRRFAIGHEPLLWRTLATSSDAAHRAIAAELGGYARRSPRQIAALVRASRDPDEGVRNDAIRALAVIAGSDPGAARSIPAAGFVEMASSGSWEDRNKAVMLLEALTRTRDRELLALLRVRSLDALVEMARWRSRMHASAARTLVGRIAGIDEARLARLVGSGEVEEILAALPPRS